MDNVVLPVGRDVWPLFYREATAHPVVELAYGLDPLVVERPEEWLRAQGYTLEYTFEEFNERLELASVCVGGAKFATSFRLELWKFVALHCWRPWLLERGWEPGSHAGDNFDGALEGRRKVPAAPVWVAPSGATYLLWDDTPTNPRERWDGLLVALGRERLDAYDVRTAARAERGRGFRARGDRWWDDPPDCSPDVLEALRRAWPNVERGLGYTRPAPVVPFYEAPR